MGDGSDGEQIASRANLGAASLLDLKCRKVSSCAAPNSASGRLLLAVSWLESNIRERNPRRLYARARSYET